MTKEKILARLDDKLRMPGVTNIWTQPIRNRIDMMSTGIRTQVGVKVFGNDLATIERVSQQIQAALQHVPGAVDLYAERITGAPYLEITVNREAAARYGIGVGDVEDVIETAIGGKNLTTTIEGRQRFPVRVRYARDFREDPDGLRNVLVAAPNGTQVPLGMLADIRMEMGPSMISSENGLLRGTVLMNVRGRDVGGFVREAQQVVAQKVKMPAGFYIEWSGQYEHQISAKKRLRLVMPVVFLIILILLYMTYNSWREALHVILAVPFALSGGVFLVKVAGIQLLGGRVGGIHRPVRDGRADRGGDGDLPGRSGSPQNGRRRAAHPRAVAPGGDGRRPAASASQADDGGHGGGRPVAHHVVGEGWRRGHEAAGRARAGRHGQLADPRVDRNPGHLHLAARARAQEAGHRRPGPEQRGSAESRQLAEPSMGRDAARGRAPRCVGPFQPKPDNATLAWGIRRQLRCLRPLPRRCR